MCDLVVFERVAIYKNGEPISVSNRVLSVIRKILRNTNRI